MAPFSGGDHSPYLGVGAHQSWIEKHRDLVPGLYRTYAAAANWITANPVAAAEAIVKGSDPVERKAIEQLIRDNSRLGMNVTPAGKLKGEMEAVYRAGMSLGFLKTMPSAATIYQQGMD